MINIGSYIFHKVHLSIGGIIPVEIRKYSWLVQTILSRTEIRTEFLEISCLF